MTWPPTGAATVFVPDLPSPAYVLSRVRASAVIALVLLPVLFLAGYARLLRGGLPVSRLINPGVLGVVVLATLALGAWLVPRIGRPTVVAGVDWVAGRTVFSGHWRMVPLGTADRYSRRDVRSRSRTTTVLSIAAPSGQHVSLTFPLGDAGLGELLQALQATGAREEPSGRAAQSRRRVAMAAVAFIVVFALPAVYLEVGPLRLLPRPIAGAFSWSGCRATLAAEGDHPTPQTTFVTNPLPAGGDNWHLIGEERLTAAEFAQRTENPRARLAHLTSDGLVAADQVYLRDSLGHTVAFESLRFATPGGALSYDRYVNRAVCEREYGRHGPRPTEVRFFRDRSALARWVAGSAVQEVVQTSVGPFATKAEVYAVAGSLGA